MNGPGDPDLVTLAQAKAWLREMIDDGAECPCCTQFAKVYRRKLNSGMAWTLIRLWRTAGQEFTHLPEEILAHGGELAKLRYWGLVEEAEEKRDDGGRAGWWRVTEDGERFVLRRLRVPQYVRLYDGRRLDLAGDWVDIRDCLGSKFSYDELMAGI